VINLLSTVDISGLVKEFDAPSVLMGRPSLFGAMVQEYASRSSSTQATDG
jgi:ATP-binding cassette, subfamily C (CFTR/MRP), member 1